MGNLPNSLPRHPAALLLRTLCNIKYIAQLADTLLASPKTRTMNPSTLFASLITFVGVLLLLYMVTVEGEMGAIPLLLIVGGAGWFIISRRRARTTAK
jgi:hypothetical protein